MKGVWKSVKRVFFTVVVLGLVSVWFVTIGFGKQCTYMQVIFIIMNFTCFQSVSASCACSLSFVFQGEFNFTLGCFRPMEELALLKSLLSTRLFPVHVCLFVLGFYAVATVI